MDHIDNPDPAHIVVGDGEGGVEGSEDEPPENDGKAAYSGVRGEQVNPKVHFGWGKKKKFRRFVWNEQDKVK